MRHYTEPELYDAGGDLAQRWFVFCYQLDPETGRKTRRRFYCEINRAKTLKERRRQATSLLLVVRQQLAAGLLMPAEPEPPPRPKTLAQAMQLALAAHGPTLRPKTLQTYQSQLRGLYAFLGPNYPLAGCDSAMAYRFLDQLMAQPAIGPRTRNNYLLALRTLFELLVQRGYLEKNPWKAIRTIAAPVQRNHAWPAALKAPLLDAYLAYNPALLTYTYFIYLALVRPGEVRGLRVGDIDLAAGTAHIRPEIAKTKHSDVITLPAPLMARLKHLEGLPVDWYVFGKASRQMGQPGPTPVGRDWASKSHNKAAERAGLQLPQGSNFYSWKENGVSDMNQAGLSDQVIIRQARWRDPKMKQHYEKSWRSQKSPEIAGYDPLSSI